MPIADLPHVPDHLPHEQCEVGRLPLKGQLASLETRIIQQTIDEGREPLGLLGNAGQRTLNLSWLQHALPPEAAPGKLGVQ